MLYRWSEFIRDSGNKWQCIIIDHTINIQYFLIRKIIYLQWLKVKGMNKINRACLFLPWPNTYINILPHISKIISL